MRPDLRRHRRHRRHDRAGRPALLRVRAAPRARRRQRGADRARPGRRVAGRRSGAARLRGRDRTLRVRRLAGDQPQRARGRRTGRLRRRALHARCPVRAQPRRRRQCAGTSEQERALLELERRLQVPAVRQLGAGQRARVPHARRQHALRRRRPRQRDRLRQPEPRRGRPGAVRPAQRRDRRRSRVALRRLEPREERAVDAARLHGLAVGRRLCGAVRAPRPAVQRTPRGHAAAVLGRGGAGGVRPSRRRHRRPRRRHRAPRLSAARTSGTSHRASRGRWCPKTTR